MFAKKLKSLRKSRKMTQEQLAELVNVDFRYISLLENAKSFPSCDLIEKLSSALNAPYKDMFDFEEDINRENLENDLIKIIKTSNIHNLKILYNIAKSQS